LLKALIIKLNDADGNGDMSRRPNLRIFLNFLKNECNIYAPYYLKEKDNTNKVKIRSMNSNELDKIFTKLNENGHSLLNLLPDLEESLQGIEYSLREFYNIFKVISGNHIPSIADIENRLKNWLIVFTHIGASNSTKFTPYIHILVHHVPEFLRLHGNLQIFN